MNDVLGPLRTTLRTHYRMGLQVAFGVACVGLGVYFIEGEREELGKEVRLSTGVLLFVLGVINCWSALTPALPGRLRELRGILPAGVIQTSNWLVLVAGVAMLLLSYYLLRGYRRAWWAAAGLSLVSLLGNLGKGIDWEEASVAAIMLISLLVTRHDYFLSGRLKVEAPQADALERARELLASYGRGSLDYFKTYADKQLWLADDGEAFVAYKRALGYALVLEGPVCAAATSARATTGYPPASKRTTRRPASCCFRWAKRPAST